MNDVFNSNNSLARTIAVCAVVSALVGSVFGYYGAQLTQLGSSPLLSTVQESSAVTGIVEDYSPAVVSIVATRNVTVIRNYSPLWNFCGDPFFRQFFSGCENVPQPEQSTQRQQVGAGTGFIVQTDGLIATNKHVVDITGAEITVIMSNEKEYPASILTLDSSQDIALLKIDPAGGILPTVKLGDSDTVRVGETVVAIGNALGQFSNSVSKGIVSGLFRTITAASGRSIEQLEKVIQTDAAINPGNSGGPLLNLKGEVIGINTAIASEAQNVGFAIPINQVKQVITNLTN